MGVLPDISERPLAGKDSMSVVLDIHTRIMRPLFSLEQGASPKEAISLSPHPSPSPSLPLSFSPSLPLSLSLIIDYLLSSGFAAWPLLLQIFHLLLKGEFCSQPFSSFFHAISWLCNLNMWRMSQQAARWLCDHPRCVDPLKGRPSSFYRRVMAEPLLVAGGPAPVVQFASIPVRTLPMRR